MCAGVRRGDDGIGAHHEQAADAAVLAERVEQLVGGKARARQVLGGHAPHAATCSPIRGVVDLPVARELIGFLSVFASALAVALSGQTAVAAEGLADLAERERDIDVRRARCRRRARAVRRRAR